MRSARALGRLILPPLIADSIRAFARRHPSGGRSAQPQWHRVEAGILKDSWLLLNPSCLWASAMLAGTYETLLVSALVERVQAGWICVDVGAHIGYFAILLAKLTGPRGQVHTFEPLPYNVSVLRANVERNAQRVDIHIHPVALANTSGQTVLRGIGDMVSSSRAYLVDVRAPLETRRILSEGTGTDFTVDAVRLDDLIAHRLVPRPQIIKIDTEGAELSVLRGAQETLRATKPMVVAELHTAANAAECTALLTDLGYAISVLDDIRDTRCCILAK